MTCPHGVCDGTGYIEVFALHSRETSQYGASYKTREWCTKEQAERLTRLIDQQKQVIYSGVRRCVCQPTPAPIEEEMPRRRRK